MLSHHGIKITGRSRRLTLNYRTTRENLSAALQTLEGGDYRDLDLDESVEATGYRSARSGPVPVFKSVDSREQEVEEVVAAIQGWLAPLGKENAPGVAPETIGVLVHDQRSRDRMVEALALNDIPARSVDRERPQPGQVPVMTMHRAKGLEFSKVVIAGHGIWPGYFKERIKNWDTSLQADADLRERSLLYVAMTRARDELVVITPQDQ
ncbi:3'-5' exonuclease [Stomatohabitans albus]|uniref:3'-5' exonuclease n=1 Tax=Stomatohabitans albus TaxID=3110766 RepID=UPI00300D64F2